MPVGHVRQTSEHIPEVSVRIDPAATAAFDDGVEDGAALAGIGFAEEEPVLFSDGSGPDRVFDQVVVDLAIVRIGSGRGGNCGQGWGGFGFWGLAGRDFDGVQFEAAV